ncbi:MAG: flippase-like domain-containing protein [Melioribacteraceae bacterium]|nr:flippase-like domain-containing protein [Melioribacteraceae bacterium]
MSGKVKKHILIALLAIVIIYILFTVYADYELVIYSFGNYNWLTIPLLLFLTFLTHLSRFFRWSYYLRLLKINIKTSESLLIFFSSLIMAVTPGKLGEFVKSYSLKKHADIPLSVSSPIIIAERITEFLSLLIITACGIFLYNFGILIVLTLLGLIGLILLLFSNQKFVQGFITILTKISFLKKYRPSIMGVFEKSNILLKPVPFINALIINTIGWIFEFYAFYIIIHSFNSDFSFLWASFIFAFSIVVGAASMLPGGLGITDGSLSYLLMHFNINNENAVAITIITRTVTLWFTILLGIIFLLIYTRKFGKVYSK